MTRVHIGKGLGSLSEDTLRFFRQIGVDQVLLPANGREQSGHRPLVPPPQTGPSPLAMAHWEKDRIAAEVARVQAVGLQAVGIPLNPSGSILMGLHQRDRDITTFLSCLTIAGELGLRVLTYSFTALRASEGYAARYGAGRGGASMRDYDPNRIADQPPLSSVGEHSRKEMWSRLSYFLRAVVPHAEAIGVRLALHPNDPPVSIYRGVAQPVRSLQDMLDALDIVDSPSNGLFLDTGVLTELGEDVPQVIRSVGARQRIVTVHMRNVHIEDGTPGYLETYHDQGDCDLAECMRALYDVGYDGLIDPDHTPQISGDTCGSPDSRAGWALAIGQLIGLRTAIESERRVHKPVA